MEKKYHIKAFMDNLDENENLINLILNAIPNKHDDDVFEFDITINNIKDITEEVGVDKEGCRAFQEVEIKDLDSGGDGQ